MKNEELIKLVKAYSQDEETYNELILKKSKENVVAILTNLITFWINDKNSSSIREIITTLMAGYIPIYKKIGYDGEKINKFGKHDFIEVKPKNIYLKEGGKWSAKLDGSGNFTDFRWEKLERMKKHDIHMVVSGFVSGKMIYILKFKFNSPNFLKRLEEQLIKRFPKKKVVIPFM